MIDIVTCPIGDCPEELYADHDLKAHLQDDHEPWEIRQAVVELTKAVASAKAHTECQACGCYGATPADHPLCDDCKEGISG